MRTNIAIEGIRHLQYEIREIVEYGHQLRDMGVSMTWENIGDPVAAGEAIEPWIKDVVADLAARDESWAYCPSRGVTATREFLAAQVSARPGGVAIGPDDILFFNGVADAVDKIYDLIRRDARVLMQAPSYPTHSSNEGKRSDYERLQFRLDPRRGWKPDFDEIENKVRYNPQIVAIALVNPDNPTGMCYPRETLERMVAIAARYRLFLICDEIYANICYNGARTLHLSEVVGEVPALSLRGISKDYPWPGSRCGWIEMLNRERDPAFKEYCDAMVKTKMMEVCSTTLPQMSIPRVYGDPRYEALKQRRAALYERRANDTFAIFDGTPGVVVNPAQGAFYFCVTFEPGVLTDRQTLQLENPAIREFVQRKVRNVALDKRFVYHLMAATGICVTPLSGFHSDVLGFRLTTLRSDDEERMRVLNRIRQAILDYTGGTP